MSDERPDPYESVYLGDGLYAEFDGFFHVELYTHNGVEKRDVVYLDDEVRKNLFKYLARFQ